MSLEELGVEDFVALEDELPGWMAFAVVDRFVNDVEVVEAGIKVLKFENF